MATPIKSLKKDLKLFDVFAISTGAMFSSGFFLLPGLAAAQAGPAVFVAYLIAGVLILPAMFSQAELSTAMPKAGGTYYFLDRSLGPLIGTVGGLGTYAGLVLKTAFALIGIGAYAAIFIDLPIRPVAIVLTVVFAAINIMGAKETTGLQRVLVSLLLAVLAFFTIQGVMEVAALNSQGLVAEQFEPFLPFGIAGLLSTVGLVFVSYNGLTKVASVAEEVQNPERNIPLGMILSLIVTTAIYVVGVFIMVSVLEPSQLREDLTPVATAGAAFFDWLPQPLGLILIVAAAIAAFASTGNAGLLSSSRYPLAMARDRLIPDRFARLGKYQTPTLSIVVTAAVMIAVILLLDEEGIAKLASTFQLFIFMLLNFAVIVMRESHIESYDPGYRSPLYPWMQYFGIVTSAMLILYMGAQAIAMTFGLVVLCVAWYFYYARKRVVRDGAIYHWFARLGQRRYDNLDYELWEIMREKGLRQEDSFDELVARATVLKLENDGRTELSYEDVVAQAAQILGARVPASPGELRLGFLEESRIGMLPAAKGVLLPNLLLFDIQEPQMVVVHSREGVRVDFTDVHGEHSPNAPVHAFCFLLSPEEEPKRHLRFLAQMADRVDDDAFIERFREADSAEAIKETLLPDKRYLTLWLNSRGPTRTLIDQAISDINLPEGVLIAMIRRNGHVIIPQGRTVLREDDYVAIIGEPQPMNAMQTEYRDEMQADVEPVDLSGVLAATNSVADSGDGVGSARSGEPSNGSAAKSETNGAVAREQQDRRL